MDSINSYKTIDEDNFRDYGDYNLIEYMGNENYLKALYKYGTYLEASQEYSTPAFFDKDNSLTKRDSFEEYCEIIEDAIVKYCYLGHKYSFNDAPEFLKKKHPELFLDGDIPHDLYLNYYPCYVSDMSFDVISVHPEWLPYLKNKRISQTFLRNNRYNKDNITHYFKIFGENGGLMLGYRYPDTVNKMLYSTLSIDLSKKWYDKTNGRFIPHPVVMQAFDIDEADKFLSNGRKWSKLMNIKEYSYSDERVDALLKLAYVFGCFDDDSKGYNQLYKLLTESPKTISKDDFEKLKEKEDNSFAFRSVREQLGITGDKLSEKIYTQINENEYELTIDQSVNSDIFNKINNLLSSTINYPVLTAEKAHKLFGRFKLQYDPKFREFLFDNLSIILSDIKYSENIASIQRNFKNICAINSNRKLTLDMALNYVSTMKYSEVDTVNDEVARISSIVGYEQEEFEILQQIYNYGKQRIYSSIPRTYNKIDEFDYEILRLDNPLPIAVGPLTDCCQELHDQAEWCMDHSMTSPDGRLFVVKDLEENIIAESWVWRNKNTICFDNIEIPNKVFNRYSNKYIAKKVYDIYKHAAEELVKKDNDKYKELLDKNIITMDEYNGLKLSKVTVGLGYNDIAEVIKKNSKKDTTVMRPLDYKGPIKLTYGPYTNDSKVQYILKSTGANTVYNGKNLYIFNDDYQIFDKKSLDTKDLLNIISFDNFKYNYSDIMDSYEEDNTPMKAISDTYNIDIDNTMVLKNANFVIIYSNCENNVKLYDIMINSKVQINNKKIDITDIVIEQLSLALKQISDNNNFDITELDDDAKLLYERAIKFEKHNRIK